VGYAGGTARNPTYQHLGDHTETVQIDYDPARISYSQLLAVFWSSHNPTYPPWSRQYQSIIFYHDDDQRKLALETKEHQEASAGVKIFTEIVPATEFYLAEDYHQKYYLRGVPALMKEFSAKYPDTRAFIGSTVAARVNGYLGGHGNIESLTRLMDTLHLSPDGKRKLLEIASHRSGRIVCT